MAPLRIAGVVILAAGTFAFNEMRLDHRSSQDGIANAKSACTLLDEALPGLVAFPGKHFSTLSFGNADRTGLIFQAPSNMMKIFLILMSRVRRTQPAPLNLLPPMISVP